MTGSIGTLLVANRGEIACRIMRTAKKMGIRTVAVYSDADRRARHVRLADVAVPIGAAPPTDSYLRMEAVLAAAKSTGADAIHPGYGFLAENAEFAEACAATGIIFVGPPAAAIRAMGLKGVARQTMSDSGVPVLPGVNKIEDAAGDIASAAEAIGYPVLLKPEAGGGGKGMKIVRSPNELDEAIKSARREAASSFGNDSLMLEKYLDGPRHIEIQVFADQHGQCIHLNERDCSLQRRHQKIIEESPAPGVSPVLREKMGAAAVAAASAIGYVGAGTVEFLLGEDDGFYFMEMNTRLQVEHPVTEAVTGLDLVEWQLEVAAGNHLPIANQAEVNLRGHAIEARLYAEDPLNDFLPVSGHIHHLSLPPQTTGSTLIRVDSGVDAGDVVSVFYDPMMMKVIAHAENREKCIESLRHALQQIRVAGLKTNRDFLVHLLASPVFAEARVTTNYLDNHPGEVFSNPGAPENHAFLCGAAITLMTASHASSSPWDTLTNFRLTEAHAADLELVHGSQHHTVSVEIDRSVWIIRLSDQAFRCNVFEQGRDALTFSIDGTVFELTSVQHGAKLTLFSLDRTLEFTVPLEDVDHVEDEGNVQAPMSGKIISVLVTAGEEVLQGKPLAVIEAMKMEHTIKAPADGIVAAVHFTAGEIVDEGIDLFDFQAAE